MDDKLLQAMIEEAEREAERLRVAAPGRPMLNARWFINGRHKTGEDILLLCQGGMFYAFNGTCWPVLEEDELRHQVYLDFENACYFRSEDKPTPFAPNKSKVENIIAALRAITFTKSNTTVPKWLDGRDAPPANEIVVCQNGLVNVTTQELMPHTPQFFQHHAVQFDFTPDAPPPERWHKFLGELFDDDYEALETFQEWMGYLVSADTRQQKMLMIHGPIRSGKGTIARIVRELLGKRNVVGPTLASLCTNFGLSPLIGKPVAIVSDARIATRNGSMITERLLSISGEDVLTVDRKNKEPLTVMFPTRIVVMTNELPRLIDSAGALASRFIVLTLTESFYGKEDTELTEKLKTELPGIFNWALVGLSRLRNRGHFVQPKSGSEAVIQLRNLSSPITTFVEECCEVSPELQILKDDLFAAWKRWCQRNGHAIGSKNTFSTKLYAAYPMVGQSKPRDQGRRPVYVGIGCEMF